MPCRSLMAVTQESSGEEDTLARVRGGKLDGASTVTAAICLPVRLRSSELSDCEWVLWLSAHLVSQIDYVPLRHCKSL